MANTVQYGISATYFLHYVNCFYTFDNIVKKILSDIAAKMNIKLEPNTDRKCICCGVYVRSMMKYFGTFSFFHVLIQNDVLRRWFSLLYGIDFFSLERAVRALARRPRFSSSVPNLLELRDEKQRNGGLPSNIL
jgi:hypothetical protein